MKEILNENEIDYLDLEFNELESIHSKISFLKHLLPCKTEKDTDLFALVDMAHNILDDLRDTKAWSLLEETYEAIKDSELFKNEKEDIFLHKYFVKALLPYYLKTNRTEKVETIKEFIIRNYNHDFDSIDQLITYFITSNEQSFLKEVTKKTYTDIKDNPNLLFGANNTILFRYFNVLLEENYVAYSLKGKSFDVQAIREEIYQINPEMGYPDEEPIAEFLEKDYTFKIDERIKLAIKSKNKVFTLLTNFKKYALQFGIPFIISSQILEQFSELLDSKEKHKSSVILIKSEKDFDALFLGLLGFFNSNFEMAYNVFWGFFYLFDFFEEIALYNTNEANINREALLRYKKFLINTETGSSAWITYSIFENWKKPNSLSEKQWAAFKEEAEMIFNNKSTEIDQSPSEVSESFVVEVLQTARQKIAQGELATYDDYQGIEDILDSLPIKGSRKPTVSEEIPINTTLSVYPELDKYSRNDKITVEYEDGKILKDVKFKKVEKDLKAGKCTIIEE